MQAALPDEDIGSVSHVITSAPFEDAPHTTLWRILARSLIAAQIEADKISRAASTHGFASFTPPHQLETGTYKHWFQIVGVTYDLL